MGVSLKFVISSDSLRKEEFPLKATTLLDRVDNRLPDFS